MDSKVITGIIGFLMGLVPSFLQFIIKRKELDDHKPLEQLNVVSEAEQRLRNDMNRRIEDLKQENRELKIEIKDLKKENRDLQDRVTQLEKALASLHVDSDGSITFRKAMNKIYYDSSKESNK